MATKKEKRRPVDPELAQEAKSLLYNKRALLRTKGERRKAQTAKPPAIPENALPERSDYDSTQVRENGQPGRTVTGRRTDRQRAIDDAAIARMVVLGYTQEEIGKRLLLTVNTVRDAIDRMEQIITSRAVDDLARQRAQQSMQLDAILGECLEGIRESKKPQVSTTTEVNGTGLTDKPQLDEDGKPIPKTAAQILANKQRVVKKVTERTADVNYLFASTDVIKTQMKLLGTAAPTELRLVVEERAAGLKAVLDAVAAEITDPDVLARIISRVENEGPVNIVAESGESALYPAQETEEQDLQ